MVREVKVVANSPCTLTCPIKQKKFLPKKLLILIQKNGNYLNKKKIHSPLKQPILQLKKKPLILTWKSNQFKKEFLIITGKINFQSKKFLLLLRKNKVLYFRCFQHCSSEIKYFISDEHWSVIKAFVKHFYLSMLYTHLISAFRSSEKISYGSK